MMVLDTGGSVAGGGTEMNIKMQRVNRLAFALLAVVSLWLGACTAAPSTVTTTVTSNGAITATVTTPITSVTTVSGIPITQTVIATSTATVTGGRTDFVAAAAKALPSVVIIEDQQPVSGYFGRQVMSQAAGTGWILDSDGDIVTNAHVVYQATNIQVTLADGSVYPATIVQTDVSNDLAIIKITAPNLKAASTGDSSKLAIGQSVGAVGNSLDQGVRFTGGYISRLDGTVSYTIGQTTVNFNNLIETDTVINPGNSGGVLIDDSGNIVGITNAAMVGTTDVSGFGYAIPINTAMSVIQKLMSGTTQQ
jgi:serine protease Do